MNKAIKRYLGAAAISAAVPLSALGAPRASAQATHPARLSAPDVNGQQAIFINEGSGQCLASGNGNVYTQKCPIRQDQTWTEDMPGPITLLGSGECLTADDSGKVSVTACTGGGSQNWMQSPGSSAEIENVSTSQCLTSDGEGNVSTTTCAPDDVRQSWVRGFTV
jgi:Ricin-type beta-trefoil lectin domain